MHPLVLLPGMVLLIAAAVGDVQARRIPNGFCLALAGLGLVRIALAQISGAAGFAAGLAAAGLDLAAFVALLLLGAGLFAAGWFGGGDAKLLAATGLWLGHAGVPGLLVVMSLAGGLVALLFLGRAAFLPAGPARSLSLPYGLAIAAGGVATAGGLL